VEAAFGFAKNNVVSFPDLYAGKVVTALDRQHPRDSFYVKDLPANEGIVGRLCQAFIIYLLSHGRPVCEVLEPTRKVITKEFLQDFERMTDDPIALHKLVADTRGPHWQYGWQYDQ
jgi:hypothetical protein